MTKIKIVLVALAALLPSYSFAGGGALESCFDMDSLSCEIFSLTNEERAKVGLPALTYSPTCFSMAQEQSDDMADRDYFSHDRPASKGRPAENFSQRVTRFGLQYGVGENIAIARDAVRAMQLWMNSPGHRRNILNPKFHSMGVGFRNGLFTQAFAK